MQWLHTQKDLFITNEFEKISFISGTNSVCVKEGDCAILRCPSVQCNNEPNEQILLRENGCMLKPPEDVSRIFEKINICCFRVIDQTLFLIIFSEVLPLFLNTQLTS